MKTVGALHEYVTDVKSTRFRPGENDCALFAAGWIERVTGNDLTLGLRGTYRTLEAGRNALEKMGFADHIDILAQTFDEVPVALAQVGDIAVVQNDCLGIVSGAQIYVLQPDGLGIVSLMDAEKVYRV
jgi:hypothetical protein